MEKVINARELQSYQEIFSEAQRIFVTCFNEYGRRLTKISGRKDELKELYDTFGKKELEKMISSAAAKSGQLMDVVWEDTDYANVKIVAVPNYEYERYHGSWGIIVVYRQEEYKDEKINADVKLYPTKGKYMKVTFNGINRGVKLLSLFSELFITAMYDNNRTMNELYEIKKHEDKIKEKLAKKDTIANVLQILEEDEDDIETVLYSVSKKIYEYLDINVVSFIRIGENTNEAEIIASVYDKNLKNIEDILKNLSNDILSDYDGQSILISEKDCQNIVIEELAKKHGLKRFVFIPLVTSKEMQLYALFTDISDENNWDSETIRFLFGISKMLQNYVYKNVAKKTLFSSYVALKEILNNLGSSIFVIDKETKEILFANDVLKKSMEIDFEGKQCSDYNFGCMNKDCENCIQMQKDNLYIETYDEDKDKWYDIHYNTITWIDGKKVMLCNITDITDKKKNQQKIEFQANNDFLTGLYNRMRCEEDLEKAIKNAGNNNEKGLLLFLDLDDFKHINDGLGHQYGDVLLKRISITLQQIEGIEDSCYRVGGDEFIIIIKPKFYDKRQEIINSIQNMFSNPWLLNDSEYYCTMSMGIVAFPENGDDVNELIKKADIAMYAAKKSGKNGYRYYNKGEDNDSYLKLDLEKNMRLAVALGCKEFEVYIQPIMDTKTEKCVGGEALIRWNSNHLGFLMPGQFIEVAEHLGLITPIGKYVLKKACKLNKKWSDKGLNARINVNLSVVQLLANDIVDVIREVVEDSGINTSNLVLEVTESLAINDMNRMKEVIRGIKSMGIKIALDDFGTGYSSLNYIKQLDLDVIKVDRTFIKDITTDEYAKTFVKLIAELSETLNVAVCVEGVEEKEQLDILKEMNINMIQGYYYGKPMKISEFEERFLGLK